MRHTSHTDQLQPLKKIDEVQEIASIVADNYEDEEVRANFLDLALQMYVPSFMCDRNQPNNLILGLSNKLLRFLSSPPSYLQSTKRSQSSRKKSLQDRRQLSMSTSTLEHGAR